uniref:Uncharacterized protein n=1 Tax=Leersia perrieri TaxID=77586 RepID=A0A0D9UY65_9ORYZ
MTRDHGWRPFEQYVSICALMASTSPHLRHRAVAIASSMVWRLNGCMEIAMSAPLPTRSACTSSSGSTVSCILASTQTLNLAFGNSLCRRCFTMTPFMAGFS